VLPRGEVRCSHGFLLVNRHESPDSILRAASRGMSRWGVELPLLSRLFHIQGFRRNDRRGNEKVRPWSRLIHEPSRIVRKPSCRIWGSSWTARRPSGAGCSARGGYGREQARLGHESRFPETMNSALPRGRSCSVPPLEPSLPSDFRVKGNLPVLRPSQGMVQREAVPKTKFKLAETNSKNISETNLRGNGRGGAIGRKPRSGLRCFRRSRNLFYTGHSCGPPREGAHTEQTMQEKYPPRRCPTRRGGWSCISRVELSLTYWVDKGIGSFKERSEKRLS
jgi:hypothetical protein